ncbi:MAG: NTP transferase domain-containing protein [Candidatus Eisenbacteria bacterium]|uniref:NTP transferase domain-containing protein n=1 Tax=Eiseniibacteriota bacterium TaxID=2212470 RepID=A0A7Y2H388_UNCEI|nr:NTP transferase domain-containing protein [Candidatus Eisenbacteria bacterium]
MTGVYVIIAGRTDDNGKPLALKEVDGESLLSHHVHTGQLAKLGGPICVLGPEGDVTKSAHVDFPVHFVASDSTELRDWVRTGLAAVPKDNVAFFTPVEHLPPRIDSLDQLIEALESLPESQVALRPLMRDKPGYPIILMPEAVSEILAQSSFTELEAWARQAQQEGRLAEIEVDDYNVLGDSIRP